MYRDTVLQALWDPVRFSFVEKQKNSVQNRDKGCKVILVIIFLGDSAVRSFELFRKKCLFSWYLRRGMNICG